MTTDKVKKSFNKLRTYCEQAEFKGFDPYDGLNSSVFKKIPLINNSYIARLVWIQFFKRSPINMRKIAGIKPDYNPKALGLFLSAYCNLYQHEQTEDNINKINYFIRKINSSITKGYAGACWGYNFDWQSKAFFQPKNTPTIVASSFIANSLLDAYEITKDETLIQTARSTCNFILKDLNRTNGIDNTIAFSYSPLDNSVVYNASLLGARLLARTYFYTKEDILIDTAKKAVKYCCSKQHENGSWSYGAHSFHKWIDNFHTGYNLECISDYMHYSNDKSFEGSLDRGYYYYIKNFFNEKGMSNYYNHSTYPIDIHSPSQLIITLKKLGKIEEKKVLLDQVLNWTIDKMQSKKGYFYYQINKYFTSKIPYMRWSQAWMFLSMSIYLTHFLPKSENI